MADTAATDYAAEKCNLAPVYESGGIRGVECTDIDNHIMAYNKYICLADVWFIVRSPAQYCLDFTAHNDVRIKV